MDNSPTPVRQRLVGCGRQGDDGDNSVDSRIAAAEQGVGFVPEDNLVARADLVLLPRDEAVAWSDVTGWPHAFRLARLFGRIN